MTTPASSAALASSTARTLRASDTVSIPSTTTSPRGPWTMKAFTFITSPATRMISIVMVSSQQWSGGGEGAGEQAVDFGESVRMEVDADGLEVLVDMGGDAAAGNRH